MAYLAEERLGHTQKHVVCYYNSLEIRFNEPFEILHDLLNH